MKFLFRFIKILIVSILAIFLITATGSYLLLNISLTQEKITRVGEEELSKLLDTRLTIGDGHVYPFNKVLLKDVCLYDRQGDTLLYARELIAGVDLQELLYRRLVFTTIQLYDFELSLSRDNKEAPLNLQFIVDRFKKNEERPALNLHSQVNTILMRRGKISYDVKSEQHKGEGIFDANHIGIDNFLATVSLKSIERDSVNINIRKISFNEQSGFSLHKFGVKLIGNRERVTMSNFRIILPHSEVSLSRTTSDLLSYDNFDTFYRDCRFDIEMRKALLTPSDLKMFVPQLGNANIPIEVNTHLQGTLDSLKMSHLRIQYGLNDITLTAEASARHLFSPDSMILSGAIESMTATPDGLPLILSELLPERISLIEHAKTLGAWEFQGNADKTPNGVSAKGALSCELGDIEGDIVMDISEADDIFNLTGQLKTPDFGIGRFFFAEHILGNVGLDVRLNLNQHTAGGNLWGDVDGLISHVTFKDYTYRNIELRGNYDNTYYDGYLSIDDPNGQLQLVGTLDLFERRPVVKVLAEGKNLRFGHLNLMPQYAESITQFSFSSNLTGNHIDDIEGEIIIDTLSFENNGHLFNSGNFAITATCEDSTKRLSIKSDIINGEIEGKYSFLHLKQHITDLLANYLPALIPDSTISFAKEGNQFRYNFEIEKTADLSQAFNLPVSLPEKAHISGEFDHQAQNINLHINAPQIQVKRKILFDNEVRLYKGDSALYLSARTGMLNKKKQYTGWSLNTQVGNSLIDTHLNWSNNSDTTFCGEFATSTFLHSKAGEMEYYVDILPTQIIIGDSIWDILPSFVAVKNGVGQITDFEIRHKEQYLHLDGAVSKSEDDALYLSLNDLQLDYIFDALNLKNVVFGGSATGNIIIADLLNGTPRLDTREFSVKGFSYNHAVFGDLLVHSRWDNDNQGIYLNGRVSQPGYPDTRAYGYIFPTRDSLNLTFNAKHVSLGFLTPFTEKILKDVEGHATGLINFYGRFKALNVSGNAYVERFGFGIDYLNTRFYISDTLRMTPDSIIIDNMTMTDVEGHTGVVNGFMTHTNFKNINYYLHADNINNMLVYNTTAKQSPKYYGTVYGSGKISIGGNLKETGIDIEIHTEDKTKFTFALTDNAEAEDYQFITFVDRSRDFGLLEDSVTALVAPPSLLSSKPRHQLSLNLHIEATPQASMNLLMNPATGDMIRTTGDGTIRIEYNTIDNEGVKLFGSYTVDKGSYKFNLQDLITKDFVIKTGSSIAFSGEALKSDLNIEAYYALTANLEDLDESFATEHELNRTTIPVRAMLYMTGKLESPEFKLDLNFPTVSQDIDRRIRSIISTDDMINRQIIYLLALNKFYTPDYMNVGQTHNNELASVASSALSSQLNNLLGQINENINIGTNLRSDKGDFSDVEVELALSSQLLNNRLILNGNIGYRDNAVNNNTFIGDFDLEYLLNKSGNIRLKAYNHYNDKNYYVKSALTTQGVGIMFRKEFNKWTEWFSWIKRRKNKNAEE
ncbi:MAG: translocation/assembly module TamB [Coprobacter sp.]|nr:translocation/assembly module TamB [Coprobacter sp.]